MKTIILICLFVYTLLLPRQSLAQACTPSSTMQTASAFAKFCRQNLLLSNSDMNCELKGVVYQCRGKVSGYSEPVRIYFKSDMKAPTGLKIHFHGHYNDEQGEKAWNYPFSEKNGNYAHMLAESTRQNILVVPESRGKVKTYINEIATPPKWSAFVTQLETQMGIRSKIPVSVSGHSGSDVMLNAIGKMCADKSWDCSRIKAMGLFDANYGRLVNGELVGRDGLKSLVNTVVQNQGKIYIRDAKSVGLEAVNNVLTKGVAANVVDHRVVITNHMAIMKDGDFSKFLDL